MGAMMRAVDWSATPLGPVSDWPQSLRTALSRQLVQPVLGRRLRAHRHARIHSIHVHCAAFRSHQSSSSTVMFRFV
jgi:hypothetical protein